MTTIATPRLGATPAINARHARTRATINREQSGIRAFRTWHHHYLGGNPDLLFDVTDKHLNMTIGDLLAASGSSVEVKTQGINPARFPRNWVEIGAFYDPLDFGNGRHVRAIADLLGVSVEDLRRAEYRNHLLPGRPTGAPGPMLRYLRPALGPMTEAALIAYVNPGAEPGARDRFGHKLSPDGHLYLYQPEELFDGVRDTLLETGAVRGAGVASAVTLGVQIPLPRWRYSRTTPHAAWEWSGTGSERRASQALRALLH